jgi:ABC-type multidrug transport system fused ATPase/permease subunit
VCRYEYFLMLIGVVAAAGMGVTPLAFYYFFGRLVDFANDPDLPDEIRKTSYYFFGIAIVGGVSAWVSNAMFLFVGERVSARIRRELFEAITMQEVAWFDQTKTGTQAHANPVTITVHPKSVLSNACDTTHTHTHTHTSRYSHHASLRGQHNSARSVQ